MVSQHSYLRRIGWSGPLRPDLETLSTLLAAHLRAIPFENVDVLLGRPVNLDLEAIQQKLVDEKRGGYCFEHATLFAEVLRNIGFQATCHLARVVLAVPKALAPLAHLFVLVDLPEGRFVADPGFGGPAALVPVPLADIAAPQPDQTHWFVQTEGAWILRGREGDDVLDLWVTPLSDDYPVDAAVSNHFVSTHPESLFVNNLLLNRFTPGGRISVMNRAAKRWQEDRVESWQIESRADLQTLLETDFGLVVPGIGTLRIPAVPDWN